MKRILKIAILCLSCICACWLLLACSSDIEEPESGGGGDGSTVTLTIQAAVPDGTRAGGDELPEREKIDQLRIIVVDQATSVIEHNELYEFTYPEDEYSIEVKKNSIKDVYFLANAESYATNNYSYETILNDLPDKLPYTSKYEIEVKETDIDAICYIAIAAVKFDIVFNNYTGTDITIESLEIGAIANRSYLFPHNNDWEEWVENLIGNGTKNYFTDYDIPGNTVHKNFPVPIPTTSDNDDTQGNTGDGSGTLFKVSAINDSEPGSGSYTIPTFYCHESKFEQIANEGQHYTIQFEIDGNFFVSEIKTSDTNYLESLIRSTHVIITVNINDTEQNDVEVVIYGEIAPWEDGQEIEGGLTPIEPQA